MIPDVVPINYPLLFNNKGLNTLSIFFLFSLFMTTVWRQGFRMLEFSVIILCYALKTIVKCGMPIHLHFKIRNMFYEQILGLSAYEWRVHVSMQDSCMETKLNKVQYHNMLVPQF